MGTTKIPSCSVSSTLQKGTITLFHRGSTPLVLNCIKYCRTGMLQMFRTTSFRMITESPGRIGAARSWSSTGLPSRSSQHCGTPVPSGASLCHENALSTRLLIALARLCFSCHYLNPLPSVCKDLFTQNRCFSRIRAAQPMIFKQGLVA